MADEIVYRLLQGDGIQIVEDATTKTVTLSVPGLTSKVNVGDIGQATKVSAGIVELADFGEVQSGADDLRAVTPAGLAAATQANATDTTVGRILRVGAFGVGDSAPLSNGSDLNTVVRSGFYLLGNSHPNMPAGYAGGQLIVSSRGAGTLLQIISVGSSIAWRSAAGLPGSPSFLAWRSIWHDGNFDPSAKANTSGNYPGINAGDCASVNGQTAVMLAPPGQVAFFAMNSAPNGWLRANGAAVSRATYAALFAAIGTAYGAGNGSSTFNLPDYRGAFLRALDDGRGLDSGRGIGSLQGAANLAHSHGASTSAAGAHGHSGSTDTIGDHVHTPIYLQGSNDDNGDPGSFVVTSPNFPNGQRSISSSQTGPAGAHSHSVTINGVGDHSHGVSVAADGASEARPINYSALACIKY